MALFTGPVTIQRLCRHDYRALIPVSYASNNRVVTLTGNVDSQAKRAQAEKIAAAVPNVQQVVNELQVSGQKATSTK